MYNAFNDLLNERAGAYVDFILQEKCLPLLRGSCFRQISMGP